MVPEKIPSIYNGEKTVIYGLLMEKSEQKGENVKCKATLTGDIIGKKFKFDIPFELTEGQSEKEDVSVIHQLAVKGMIQEWQDDEEPYEQKHKMEITELSTDACMVSRYTAYIAVDVAENKPVSGSMQGYKLTAGDAEYDFECKCAVLPTSTKGIRFRSLLCCCLASSPSPPEVESSLLHKINNRPEPDLLFTPSFALPSYSAIGSADDGMLVSQEPPESTISVSPPSSPPTKQTEAGFIVSLQQANGSWLLNDQLAGVVSKSVEELKSCCPVSCDDTMTANIWATLVVIELLKKKYPSVLDELELIIMKAEQWLHNQVLPSGVNLATLKENANKLL